MLFLLVVGGGHCHKFKVLVTGVKIICKKISWQQLVQGGGKMPRLFFHFFKLFFYVNVTNDEVTLT